MGHLYPIKSRYHFLYCIKIWFNLLVGLILFSYIRHNSEKVGLELQNNFLVGLASIIREEIRMLRVADPKLIEIMKKESKLMYLCDQKSRTETHANRKNSPIDRLNQQILDLEMILEGEYELLSLDQVYD